MKSYSFTIRVSQQCNTHITLQASSFEDACKDMQNKFPILEWRVLEPAPFTTCDIDVPVQMVYPDLPEEIPF